MKKVVVTGANGFLGSYLVEKLIQRGYAVWAVVRNEQSDISKIAYSGVTIVYCDLSEIQKLPEKLQERTFDAFYHLAWSESSGKLRCDYKIQMESVLASTKAIEVAKRLGCKRFVGAGSIAELMYREYLHQDGATPAMETCYAVGKMAAEYLGRCVATHVGIEFVWGYLSNFYGAGDSTQNLINYLIQSYQKGEIPELTEGEQMADFTYVSDIALGLIFMAECGESGASYYVGRSTPRPLKEFVVEVRDCINPSLDTGLGRKRFRGMAVDFDKIDAKKLERCSGFQPEVSFQQGIQLTLNWMKNREYYDGTHKEYR